MTTTTDALKFCASCGDRRGNVRTGWDFPLRNGVAVSCTCPNCPRADEPIRRVAGQRGVRFRAVVDATPKGATKRKQVTKTLATLDDARAFVEQVRAEVAESGAYASTRETVAQLCDRWLANRRGVRQVTLQGYDGALRPVRKYLGQLEVAELHPAHVDDFTTWALREGGAYKDKDGNYKPLSARSVRYALVALGAAVDLAVRDRALASNPVRQVEAPKSRRAVGHDVAHWQTIGVGESASCPDMDRFRETADRDALAGVFRLTLCGLTRADLHGLRWDDIDLEQGLVTVRKSRVQLREGETVTDDPKSAQRRRTVSYEAIQPGTTDLLRTLKARQAADQLAAGAAWHDSGNVLVDALGRPTAPDAYTDRFQRLVAAAGVPRITLHAVRHSLALLLHQLGVPPADAAALLGHTVEVYLSTYLPEGGTTGAANAAAALARIAQRDAS